MTIDKQNYRRTSPPVSRPSDFFEFWQKTRDELTRVDCDIQVIDSIQHEDGLLERWFQFPSLSNVLVTAYSLSWPDGKARPTVVYTHGYNGQCDTRLDWARLGLNVIGVDLRGMGRSKQANLPTAKRGYILTGIDTAETSILRGTICDFIRAGELDSLLENNTSRHIFYGYSFGGTHALIAAALTHKPDLVICGVPSLGWSEGRRQLVKRGSGRELNLYLNRYPESEQGILQALSYYDTMNFADQIKCPTLIGAGRLDAVVPVETVYAICNHLLCPHEVRELPVSHSQQPEEALWQQFESEWLKLAIDGAPADFGNRGQGLKLFE